MGRKSRIDQMGLGSKLVAYAQAGLPHDEIIRKIEKEHNGAILTYSQISRYLATHSANNASEPPDSAIIKQISVDEFRIALLDAIREARSNYLRYRDDPMAGWRWFKSYLETLDRMGKMAGAYPSDQQPMNVQLNLVKPKEEFERSLKDAEEYFRAIEREENEEIEARS